MTDGVQKGHCVCIAKLCDSNTLRACKEGAYRNWAFIQAICKKIKTTWLEQCAFALTPLIAGRWSKRLLPIPMTEQKAKLSPPVKVERETRPKAGFVNRMSEAYSSGLMTGAQLLNESADD
jgi:hypothetical protein